MSCTPTEIVVEALEKQTSLLRDIQKSLKILLKGLSPNRESVNTKVASQMLGITQAHIRHLIRTGELPAIKLGTGEKQSRYLINVKEVERFKKRKEVAIGEKSNI